MTNISQHDPTLFSIADLFFASFEMLWMPRLLIWPPACRPICLQACHLRNSVVRHPRHFLLTTRNASTHWPLQSVEPAPPSPLAIFSLKSRNRLASSGGISFSTEFNSFGAANASTPVKIMSKTMGDLSVLKMEEDGAS